MTHRLLDNLFAPITSEVGFLESPAVRARDAFVAWDARIMADRGVRVGVREARGDLATRLKSLLPLTSVETRRALWVPTRGRWTAYFDNGWRGTDAYPVVSTLCERLVCQGLRTVCIDNTITSERAGARGRHGATILEVYAPTREGCHFLNTRRAIYAANDGGRWKFGTGGTALPFEEPHAYTAKRIRDRFTPEMLDRYLKALGISLFDPGFFDTAEPSYLVERHGPTVPDLQEFTLEQARADW